MFDTVEKLKEFIRHPSVSTDSKFREGMKGAQEFVSELLLSLGFSVDVVKTDLHPIIFAQRDGEKSWPHVVIYGHYDVQPADPLNLWKSPAFEPTMRDGQIYARGSADMKSNLVTLIQAVEALAAVHGAPPVNLTFFWEGEEEIGSPHALEAIEANKDRLKADGVRSCD